MRSPFLRAKVLLSPRATRRSPSRRWPRASWNRVLAAWPESSAGPMKAPGLSASRSWASSTMTSSSARSSVARSGTSSTARTITGADAGSVYVVEDEGRRLRFRVAHNDSVTADLAEFTLPVSDASIVGHCVRTGEIINIPDLSAETAHAHDRSFDDRFGYETRSMLTVPMRPPQGQVVGAVQLINAKHGRGPLDGPQEFARVHAFSDADARLVQALATQGAVALENAGLYAEIEALFEGFVRASVTAIEQRDPTTSGHSQRVADLTVALAEVVDGSETPAFRDYHFTRQELREIEYAGLLHDFGKAGVREQVLVKAKKLHDAQLERVLERFEHLRTVTQLRWFQAQLAVGVLEALGPLEVDEVLQCRLAEG